jgi:hypothetical protein
LIEELGEVSSGSGRSLSLEKVTLETNARRVAAVNTTRSFGENGIGHPGVGVWVLRLLATTRVENQH